MHHQITELPLGSDLSPFAIVDLSPEQNAQASAVTPGTGVAPDELATHLHDPDWVDVAKATWQLGVVGQGLLHLAAGNDDGQEDAHQSFDPFEHYAANKGLYSFAAPYVAAGAFDHIRSEAQFRRQAEVIRQNKDARELIANGDGGSTIANIGASLLDLPTILSFGLLGTGLRLTGLASRMAAGGTVGFLDSVAAEAALQGLDPTRTASEAFLNIGTGTFIGAGLGGLFKHLPPDSPLQPGHPENPMHVDAVHETVEQRMGLTPEETAHVGGSIGAAAARVDDDRIATGGAVSKFMDRVLSAPTPLGRMNGYRGSGQGAIAQLYDLGGLMLEKNKRGLAHAPEAEAYVTMYKHEAAALVRDIETSFRETAIDLGSSALAHKAGGLLDQVTLGAVDKRRLTRATFFDLVDESLTANMTNNVKFQQQAREALQAVGITGDEATKVLAGVQKASDASTRFMDSMMDEAERIGLARPEDRRANYGKPMLYVKAAIDNNQGAMRAMALRHFQDKPPQEFLVEHGYVKDPSAAPAAEGVVGPAHADWKTIVASGDLKLQEQALTHFRGAQEDLAAEMAEQRVLSAQQRQLRATEDFAVVSDGMDAAKADLKDANLKRMRARVREVEANWHGRKLAVLDSRIAEADRTLARLDEKYPTLNPERSAAQLGEDIQDTVVPHQAQASRAGTEISNLTDALSGTRRGVREAHERVGAAREDLKTASTPAELEAARAEREMAVNARRTAVLERDEAMASLNRAASSQRQAQRFVDEAVADAQKLVDGLKTAEQRAGVEAALTTQRERIDALRRAYTDAEQAWKEAGQVFKEVRSGLKITRSALAQTSSELRKAVFAKKRIERTTPLSHYVDSWVDSMRGADRAPGGMLLDRDPLTGRLQERKIEWSADEMRELKKLGFIETDVVHMMERYAQDMGGEIALHKSFNGRTREQVLRDANADYQALIEKATDPKEIAALNRARKLNEEDIAEGWNRIKGHHDLTDNNGLTWFADKIGRIGLLRYIGGFVFGAAGDIATSAMAARGGAGGFMKYAATAGKDFRYILDQAKKDDPGMKELAKILGTFENAAHMATSDRALGRGSAADLIGFGTGMTREITGKVDKYLGLAADKANAMSLLKGFSDSVRRSAGLVQLANIAEWTKKGWGELSPGQQADFLALGIGSAESKRLGALFAKHATTHENGLVSPNMHRWLKEPDGNEMADLLTTALEKTQKRASYTAGMGHQPLLMGKWYGKLFLQFQSYAFQFYSNFMRTAAQRMALTPSDAKAYQASALALAAGVVTAEVAYWRKGEKPDRNSKGYAYAIVQRSGIMGWAGSYSDAGMKLFAPSVAGSASKFSQNSWLSDMLGPGMGTLETLSTLGADAARGEWSDAGKKAKTLVPMRQQYDLLNRLFGDNP